MSDDFISRAFSARRQGKLHQFVQDHPVQTELLLWYLRITVMWLHIKLFLRRVISMWPRNW